MNGVKGALGWADKRKYAPPCKYRNTFWPELETDVVGFGAALSRPYQ